MTPSENLVSIFTIFTPNLLEMRGLLERTSSENLLKITTERTTITNPIEITGVLFRIH